MRTEMKLMVNNIIQNTQDYFLFYFIFLKHCQFFDSLE